MPYIKVDLDKINGYANTLSQSNLKIRRIKSEFLSIQNNLDRDVKTLSNLSRRLSAINSEMGIENSSLSKMISFCDSAKQKYTNIDSVNELGGQKVLTNAPVNVTWDIPFEYIDAKKILKDVVSAGITIHGAYKAGFFKSGFNIKQVGDYVIVCGKNTVWKGLKGVGVEKIKGRRYKVGSAKDVECGASAMASGISVGTKLSRALKHNFKDFGKSTFGSAASILGYLDIAWETGKNIVGNCKNGASVSKIAADATTDIAKGMGEMAVVSVGAKLGAAVGTLIPIPIVGSLVGSVVGGAVARIAYDYLIDGGLKIGGKSVAGWVSTGLEKAYSKVGDAFKGAAKGLKKAFKKIF